MGWFTQSNDGQVAATLARLERKIDALMASLGVEVPAGMSKDSMDDVRALAAAGQKIEAIKRYREKTGAGLAEAKAAVERGV
jgi:ribosomal protein L7/L12